jgi:enediyne biosynthesis protein E4
MKFPIRDRSFGRLWQLAVVSCLLGNLGCGRDEVAKPTLPGTGKSIDSGSGVIVGADAREAADVKHAPAIGATVPAEVLQQITSLAEVRGKVCLLTVHSQGAGSLSPRLLDLHQRLSVEPAAGGIRLLTLVAGNASAELSASIEAERPDGSPDWLVHEVTDAQLESLASVEEFEPVAVLPVKPSEPELLLIDRELRLRGRYSINEPDQFDQLLSDINFVVPEFEPASYGHLSSASGEKVTHLAQPPMILDNGWFKDAIAQQQAAADSATANLDFQLTDSVQSTGIDLNPQIVDDQRWRLQVNHYDHGNGVSVADVDGDGRLDIYFVTQAGSNALYRNLGDGKFENITKDAGVALADRIGVTSSFCDVDNDGDPDLFVTTVRGGNVLFENTGSGRFRDATAGSGLEYSGHSSSAVFFDYDRDGNVDMFLCNVGTYTTEEHAALRIDRVSKLPTGTDQKYYVGMKDAFAGHLKYERSEQSILYRNLGGMKFKDVSEETGLIDLSWSGEASPIDANGDRWLDLYVLSMQGHDEYYQNDEGRGFLKKSRDVFPRTAWGAMGIKVFDFNNDGRFDIFVTDMHSDMSEDVGFERERLKARMQWPESFVQSGNQSIYGNAFYHQTEDGQFEEVSDKIGAENYWPWGLTVADINADGFQDAFLTSSMCFPYRYSANSLMINDGGKRFVDTAFLNGVEPAPAGKQLAEWFELDADGDDADHPICQGRSGRVVVWSARGSRSSVVFDIDDDGDLDIITHEFNTPPRVLISNLANIDKPVHSLKVKLSGRKSNRDGLGSVVTVSTDQMTQTQRMDGRSGYLSQSLMPLYFGLGDEPVVKSIEVNWPSGVTQTLMKPAIDQGTIQIEEPADASSEVEALK